MALFIRQDDNRSELQERLAAELREKAKKRAAMDEKLPDGIEGSRYLEGTKTTSSLAWVWISIVVLAVGAMLVIIFKMNS